MIRYSLTEQNVRGNYEAKKNMKIHVGQWSINTGCFRKTKSFFAVSFMSVLNFCGKM